MSITLAPTYLRRAKYLLKHCNDVYSSVINMVARQLFIDHNENVNRSFDNLLDGTDTVVVAGAFRYISTKSGWWFDLLYYAVCFISHKYAL